jgi:hypothetical protein
MKKITDMKSIAIDILGHEDSKKDKKNGVMKSADN